jgi:hypothetical protein
MATQKISEVISHNSDSWIVQFQLMEIYVEKYHEILQLLM